MLNRFIVPAAIIVGLAIGVAGRAEKPSVGRAGKSPRFQCDFKVAIDEAAAEDNRLEPANINQEVEKFLKSHDDFSLADLQNLKLHSGGGRDVLLQEVASIEVKFHKIVP